MTQLSYACTLFFSLLLTAFPFLLLGIIVSSWLLVFADAHQLSAKFPRNRLLGAIVGSSLGMILPVCQYGNIPVARRLLAQGIPLSVAISFLLAAPTLNPIVIWFTWKAFPESLSLVLYRILFAWLIAVIIAVIFSSYPDKPLDGTQTSLNLLSRFLPTATFLLPPDENQPLHRVGNLVYEYKTLSLTDQPLKVSLNLFTENLLRETLELGSLLVMGSAIAAMVQVFLPLASFLHWGQTAIQQILVMMGLSFILSLGSIANVFFANGLIPLFLKGSCLSLLIFGSILDLRSFGLIFSIFRPKPLIYLFILVAQLTFLGSLLLNFYVS
jgi:uncharacterized membrane protein YraQ (UPF0718 family)